MARCACVPATARAAFRRACANGCARGGYRRRFRGKLTRKRIAGARHPQAGKRTPAHAKAAGKAKDAPFTIAADVPSGVSAQTGDAALPRIYADETVTMIVYKPGLLARKAAPMTGVVRLAPLVDDVERYLDAMT